MTGRTSYICDVKLIFFQNSVMKIVDVVIFISLLNIMTLVRPRTKVISARGSGCR